MVIKKAYLSVSSVESSKNETKMLTVQWVLSVLSMKHV